MNCINPMRLWIWAWALSLFVSAHAVSDPEIAGNRDFSQIKSGTLFIRSAQQSSLAPLLNTDVQIQVSGVIARAKVIQHFQNPGSDWVEGTYLFPLPENAAVDHMRLRVGERIIEGVVKEKEQAKRIYSKAKREGKRTTLLTQKRPNMFTVAVANIGPNETVRVEIEYQQPVHLDNGEFSVRFPMTITPRYIPGSSLIDSAGQPQFSGPGTTPNTDQVPDASQITPMMSRFGDNTNPINIEVDLLPGFDIEGLESLNHRVKKQSGETREEYRYRIVLDSTRHDSDSDFVLRWRAAPTTEPYVALYTQEWQGNYYSMLMLTPLMQPSAVPDDTDLPRDLVFVIDVSGSMGGESIRQAKQALEMAIKRLQPRDRFNLIAFSSHTRTLFHSVQPASKAMRARAISFVRALSAGGGTEMYPALDAALTQRFAGLNGGQPKRLRQIVFLTDGAVGNEDQLFELIERKLDNSRLFTIGIGSSPNSYFMSKAADYGRGSFTHIGSMNIVAERMTELFSKLESPILTDLRLSIPEQFDAELYPRQIPDLYQGEPVVLAFKTTGLPEKLQLSGVSETADFSQTLKFEDVERRKGSNVLWARRKTDALMGRYRASYEQQQKIALKQAVVDLSLEHHLVSRFTSLVAVDKTPVRRPSEPLSSHALKNNLPKGGKIGLPQTATSAQLSFIKGLFVWFVALLVYLYCRWHGKSGMRYGC